MISGVENQIGELGFQTIGFPKALCAPGVVGLGDFEEFAAVAVAGGDEKLIGRNADRRGDVRMALSPKMTPKNGAVGRVVGCHTFVEGDDLF